VSQWLHDLKYGVRVLVRAPGVTTAAVLTLALGIGATTALFSIVANVAINPLPYPRSDQLVAVYEKTPGAEKAPIAYLNFLDWQRDTRTLAALALYRHEDYDFTGTAGVERVTGDMISAGFFETLGVAPVVGRTLRAEDDRPGAAPVVVLGGGFWSRAFGASPAVIGRSIVLDGVAYTVVGVVPARFRFYGLRRDVYTPIGQWTDPSFRDRRVDMSAHAVGRLGGGSTLPQARAEMNAIASRLAAAYPEADKAVGITVVSLKDDIVGDVRPYLYVLLAAVGFLMLMACTNVANLLLARAVARSREFAVRAALGAGRGRILRQLLTESGLLAGAGGAFGLLAAWLGIHAAIHALPAALPRASEISIDGRVLLFSSAVSMLAGIGFGLAPTLQTLRVDIDDVLKTGGRGASASRQRLQGGLVVIQVASALVLLVGAGLMARTLGSLWAVNPGFQPDRAVTFDLSLGATPTTSPAATRAHLRRVDAAMQAVPGVDAESVTLGSRPMIHDSSLPFWIDGRPRPPTEQDMPQAMFYLAEAGFARAMGLTVERGRFIQPTDDERAPVVIDIDDVFARTWFPGEDPIGRRVHLAVFNVDVQIIGVVGHVKQWGLGTDAGNAVEAQLYYPFMQLPDALMPLVASSVAAVLRTDGDPASAVGSVRRAVLAVAPRDVVYDVQTMKGVISQTLAARQLSMMLLGGFALLALLLACIGIWGVVSHFVGQRTHELGVRAALGAQRRDLVRFVLGHGARMALAGVAVGGAGAWGLTRLMASQLFGVSAHDPMTFAGVSIVLLLVAVGACYVPARRAARTDPLDALRPD
jgi:putative ABC transport system permease protein